MTKTCILCGFHDGRLTREHIWPLWYSGLHPGREYELESIIENDAPVRRKAPEIDLQPRVLCAPCNNEWGERLETAVRPRLTRMTDGEDEIVTLPFARVVAAWATLKFVAGEHLARSRRPSFFFTDAQRRRLREKTRPIEHTRMWVGRYVGQAHDAGQLVDKRSFSRLLDDPHVGADIYAVTYSIGQVAIQFVGVNAYPLGDVKDRDMAQVYIPFRPRRPWSEALSRIWPLPDDAFKWPPEKGLDDKAFQVLAGRWHEEKPSRHVRPAPPAKPTRRH